MLRQSAAMANQTQQYKVGVAGVNHEYSATLSRRTHSFELNSYPGSFITNKLVRGSGTPSYINSIKMCPPVSH